MSDGDAINAPRPLLHDADVEEVLEVERRSLFLSRTRFILKAAMILYPAFWLLDVASVPTRDLALACLIIRLVMVAAYGATVAVTYTPVGARLVTPLMVFNTWGSALGVSLMSTRLGGFSSDYYVGNMIVLFAAGLFLPWRLKDSIAVAVAVLASYLGVNLFTHGSSPAMVAPLFFQAGACAFMCLATVASDRTRRQDLELRRMLEQTNEELKKANEAKTRFFAHVSHELRTPLTLILGPLDTLRAATDDAHRRSLFDAVGANARRLLRQVNALLEVAKVEAGQLRLELAPGNIGRLVGQIVAAAAPTAERRGLALAALGLDALPDTRFDADKVETIAANLLSNALKFTPPGGRVTVRARADEERIVVEVEDTGPGIPADELPRLFARFYRAESAESSGTEGTGLGLSLARELARLHGGDISVASEDGRGSTFRMEIPREVAAPLERRRQLRRREDRLAATWLESVVALEAGRRGRSETLLADAALPVLGPAPGPAPAASRAGEPAPPAGPPPGAPRVLLVEDNADLRAFVAGQLSARYRVETAADGVAGLEAVQRVPPPDCVVSDIMMPRMDGCRLCRTIKADERLATIPVILVTAKAGREAVIEGLEVGADDYVTKPFDLRELEARIEAHLRARVLERRVVERESRLAAIGRMTSAIVHDLKNPLSAVTGFTELALVAAREGSPAHEIAEDLTGAVQGCTRLRDMLQELLEFAREGSSQIQTLPTPVADLVEQMLAPLAPILARDCVHLDLDFERARGFRCDLDRGRFQRVMENLLSNAREAVLAHGAGGGRGEGAIAVQARVEGGRLLLRIADNGPGIPPELRLRLFEPFATARKEHGTGLGLATARNIVRAHGGDLDVEADPPEGGAAFVIRLPPSRATGAGQAVAPGGTGEPPTPVPGPASPPLGVAPVGGGARTGAR